MSTTLTDESHWDKREGQARPRPPSRLNVSVADLTDLLARHINPGDSVMEVGCAPGKYLLWCAMIAKAEVSGGEFAERSFEATKQLFQDASVEADIRHEDFLESTFTPGQFDVVYSFGLIEHFVGDELNRMVRKHVEMVKPGGTAIMVIPNFHGIYGTIFSRLDRATYDTHNINIMTEDAVAKLAPSDLTETFKAYSYGRLSPWIVSFGTPTNVFMRLVLLGLNVVGLLQPFQIKAISPWLVLEITRKK